MTNSTTRARSALWRQIFANVLNMPLSYRQGGEVGPALGAARLARLSLNEQQDSSLIRDICPVPALIERVMPNEDAASGYQLKQERFSRLYCCVKNEF